MFDEVKRKEVKEWVDHGSGARDSVTSTGNEVKMDPNLEEPMTWQQWVPCKGSPDTIILGYEDPGLGHIEIRMEDSCSFRRCVQIHGP